MSDKSRHRPRQEDKMLGLAQEMILGFPGDTDIDPDPPVAVKDLQKDVDACLKARDESDQSGVR